MPAMLDDPTSPPIYRLSGAEPFHTPASTLPPEIAPRLVTLRDRTTAATLVPFTSPDQVPPALLRYLCDQLNREIEKGDTYPMIDPMPLQMFGTYWFGSFAAVMILGDIQHVVNLLTSPVEEVNWEKDCLGSFYIKPNYPGRSSHICNAGFLTTDAARNRGVGRLMGEGYLEWAPKLGYTYSVFNLVYENNIASCRIWDSLGFKRIGRVKGAGNLKSYPDQLTDAIIYGRDLGIDMEDVASEERFEKIRYYLKTGQYPSTADRAQKSRLRSAAMHYRLVPADDNDNDREGGGSGEDKLMLKDKEVVADLTRQAAIAREVHVAQHHAGINKTTATIAETYHWTRIKETASLTIRNCPKCKELSKAPVIRPDEALFGNGTSPQGYTSVSAVGRDLRDTNGPEAGAGAGTIHSQQRPGPISPSLMAHGGGHGIDAGLHGQSNSHMPLDPQLIQTLRAAAASSSSDPYNFTANQPQHHLSSQMSTSALNQHNQQQHLTFPSDATTLATAFQSDYQMPDAQDDEELASYITGQSHHSQHHLPTDHRHAYNPHTNQHQQHPQLTDDDGDVTAAAIATDNTMSAFRAMHQR